MREFVDVDRVRRTYVQHAAIITAILDGDADLGAARMESHILEGHRFVRRACIEVGLVDKDGYGDDVRRTTSAREATMSEPVLEARGVTVRFGDVVANDASTSSSGPGRFTPFSARTAPGRARS